ARRPPHSTLVPYTTLFRSVLLYAPHSAYGTPDDFHAFIDAAHGLGLSVVLDIVLNHFGPEGNYLPLLSPAFFHQDRMTPWGNGRSEEHTSELQSRENLVCR